MTEKILDFRIEEGDSISVFRIEEGYELVAEINDGFLEVRKVDGAPEYYVFRALYKYMRNLRIRKIDLDVYTCKMSVDFLDYECFNVNFRENSRAEFLSRKI